MRRQSTNRKSVPHRGEHFSVDDDPSEVEEERDYRVPQEDFAPLQRVSTLRRRTAQPPSLPRVDSQEESDDHDHALERRATLDLATAEDEDQIAEDEEEAIAADGDDDLSDAESFTLRDKQLAINQTHPFGIRIWKPALYKKNRSVEKNAEEDIHSSPSQIVSKWLWTFNCLWTIFFGWWLAAVTAFASLVCFLFSFEPTAIAYGRTFWGLAGYLFWPFGKFVKLEQDTNYTDEDEGEGRSLGEYERWRAGDLDQGRLMFGADVTHVSTHNNSLVDRRRDSYESYSETDGLLGRTNRDDSDNSDPEGNARKRRLFGRGQWTLGRIVFFALFYAIVAPLMLSVSLLCWFMVFWIPMGRVLTILFTHLRKRPLALTFHPDVSYARDATKPSSIIVCTYRAAGLKYWKYTIDGTNIFLINFLSVVAFVIIDYFFIYEIFGVRAWFTNSGLLFCLGLVSIIPLAYFIGQAVASISAQSSMGMGAFINALFSTFVEVFLYCTALSQGKAQLVEGSIVGSIFAGMLLLPGLSMAFGALRRKTQRFNVRSASATSTMLLFSVIGMFGPTLFYKIYGAHELICANCGDGNDYEDCRTCYFRQVVDPTDSFFLDNVRPYTWAAAVLLFIAYVIGLFFTLRTHAAVIWQTDVDEKKPAPPTTTEISPADTRHQSVLNSQIMPSGTYGSKPAIKDSQMYQHILGGTLRSAGLGLQEGQLETPTANTAQEHGVATQDHSASDSLPHVVPPKPKTPSRGTSPEPRSMIPGLSETDSENVMRQMAMVASTAAAVAARDAVSNPKKTQYMLSHSGKFDKRRPSTARLDTIFDAARVGENHTSVGATALPATMENEAQAAGGHDAPNWSRLKSYIILLTATAAYAAIAEVLVDTVDSILSSFSIDQKFLGMTLFALVPNTTEFLNAISFAMNGNIALSMEIGSAYVLQVVLLQVPALVIFTATVTARYANPMRYSFNLIFPQYDMVTVIMTVFLWSFINTEGKSNYFKGSILCMTYLVIMMGFFFSGARHVDIDMLGTGPPGVMAYIVHGMGAPMRNTGPLPGREL